jgi:hypothetical protein
MSDHDVQPLEVGRATRLADLFRHSHRSFVPIREGFLQIRGDEPTPGPFGALVTAKQHHALDVYLLLHAATASPPHQILLNRDYWTIVTKRPEQSLRSARAALSRSLDALESLALIRPETRSVAPKIQLLDECGTGDLYLHPAKTAERYFTLPHAYWRDGLDRKLDLAGKAVLLLARSLRPWGFTLPLANAHAWYGFSAPTLRRGMVQLIDLGLATYTSKRVASMRAPDGTTRRRYYTLRGSMARSEDARRTPRARVEPDFDLSDVDIPF